MTDITTMMCRGLAGMVLWMTVLWALHFKLHNAGIVDFGWAGGLAWVMVVLRPFVAQPNGIVFFCLRGDRV